MELVCEDEERFWTYLRQLYGQEGESEPWPARPGTRWAAGSKKVNVHALFVEIIARGGFDEASKDKKNWWEAAGIAGITGGLIGTLSYQVKLLYAERLLNFEYFLLLTPACELPSASQARAANAALPKPKSRKRKRAG
ncbi:hypothetical protein MGYG_01483 [Nannizzia gypsea CBS 118893]|uniref:ARID domain-containing protein n=1 Tax=Arthroderma gypseum (strain ATCC MYA-4604 / CBS 118893) TaxID=535722 RepID=E5R166_ARTGP|nr:hypothetical protein MGYG_01483 [Nannizzia gypsea CBS 118893]EFQ98455.1 hypothetical protein MGYG_01483 [Nannizzia gypsea CBS 118893]